MFRNLPYSPFLVHIFDVFETKEFLFVLQEFAPGGDLHNHLERQYYQHNHRPISEVKARQYAATMVLALEFLHKHGIAYRDLSLANTLINADGHLKLTDFGLSAFCKAPTPTTAITESSRRRPRRPTADEYDGAPSSCTAAPQLLTEVCGTPGFIAPEMLGGKPYNGFQTDMWSLGSVILSILTTQAPYVIAVFLHCRIVFMNTHAIGLLVVVAMCVLF